MSWPYEEQEDTSLDPPGPTWQCPEDTCQCHAPTGDEEQRSFSIMLLAHDGARMPGARCRVLHRGRVLNQDQPNADGSGWITARLPHVPATVLLEWAPASTPRIPGYPYRARYYVDLGKPGEEAGQRRLHNLGYSASRSLRENVERFQRDYGHEPVTGELADIEAELVLYHDHGCPPITDEQRRASMDDDSAADAPPSSPSFDKGPGGAHALAPSARKAKEDRAEKGPPAATPQTPAPAAPGDTQGSIRAPFAIELVIDWGRRPRSSPRADEVSGGFWLKVNPPPVTVTVLASRVGWDKAAGAPVVLEPDGKSRTSAVARIQVDPDNPPRLVRLDFKLDATIEKTVTHRDPATKKNATTTTTAKRTVLAFKQLYSIDENGALTPETFSFEDYSFRKGSGDAPPERAAGQSTGAQNGRREEDGLHPLIWHGASPGAPAGGPKKKVNRRIFINAELVDATELWWAIHPQEETPFYLNRALGARAENLRVLAWTAGGMPMIWFVVLPDAALSKVGARGADIVYFRPPPGINSFEYKPTAKGFADPEHERTTMQMLARYLLRAQPHDQLRNKGITDDATLRVFAEQLQPDVDRHNKVVPAKPPDPEKTVAVPPSPVNPMDLASKGWITSRIPGAFRPCGLEEAVNRAGAPHVLYLPLGAPVAGYDAATRAGLKDMVASALRVLWSSGAVGREMLGPPDPSSRPLWVVGHSAGNLSMWSCLQRNEVDVDRVISFSATSKGGNLTPGMAVVKRAAAIRKEAGKTLDFFVIAAPDMTHQFKKDASKLFVWGVAIDDATDLELRRTGAAMTLLPDKAEQEAHYVLSPAGQMNPFLRNLLGKWTDAEIEASAQTPGRWEFLFFHEYPVYAGERGPKDGGFTSFFQQALGAPNPLPPPPAPPE
jgi:hypothetical protein